MLELHNLIERYKALDHACAQQWWEYCGQGNGNSTEAHMLWNMYHRFRYIVRDFRFAQEYKDLAWFRDECARHECAALQELAPDWATNKPTWWLWVSRHEANLYRLTRMAVRRADAHNAAFSISYE